MEIVGAFLIFRNLNYVLKVTVVDFLIKLISLILYATRLSLEWKVQWLPAAEPYKLFLNTESISKINNLKAKSTKVKTTQFEFPLAHK